MPGVDAGRRDATNASELRGEEAGHFRKVAGVSIVAAGGPRSRYIDNLTVNSRVA